MKYEKINNFKPPTLNKQINSKFYIGQELISNTRIYGGLMQIGARIIVHRIDNNGCLYCVHPSGHYTNWGGLSFWPDQVRLP